MARTLLYYPTIDIPNQQWLRSAILYSDKVSSIVPDEYLNKEHFGDDVKYLVDENEYKPIFVKAVLEKNEGSVREFEELFIKTVLSEQFDKASKKLVAVNQSSLNHLYQIKLTSDISRFLHEQKLIEKNDDKTYKINETVGFFYMSLLAQFVAKAEDEDILIPSTDLHQYEKIAFESTEAKQPAFKLIIEKCLPVPNPDMPLKTIVKFKKKRRYELLQFREFLSKYQQQIEKAASKQELLEIQHNLVENIEKGIIELCKQYKDGGIKLFFSSFESILKMENPKLLGSLAAAGIFQAVSHKELAMAAAAVGITGTIVSSYLSDKHANNKSEFSYLFHANKKGINR